MKMFNTNVLIHEIKLEIQKHDDEDFIPIGRIQSAIIGRHRNSFKVQDEEDPGFNWTGLNAWIAENIRKITLNWGRGTIEGFRKLRSKYNLTRNGTIGIVRLDRMTVSEMLSKCGKRRQTISGSGEHNDQMMAYIRKAKKEGRPLE
jgi:hypothetical protein